MSAVLTKAATPIPVESDPLFESAHQALMFAYTFSANQYAVTAAAERVIAMCGRERYERPMPYRQSRGLKGLDGAAQAGMIRAAVLRLDPLHQAYIDARFDVLNESRRRFAVRVVALTMRRLVQVGPELADLVVIMVRRHFGEKIALDDYIEHFGLPRATLFRRAARIRKAIQEHADTAMMRIEDLLVAQGIVWRA